MDIRIGVLHTPKELEVDLADDVDLEQLQGEVTKVLEQGSGVLWLTDRKGRRVGVPSAKVAYVEFGSPSAERRVGFAHVAH